MIPNRARSRPDGALLRQARLDARVSVAELAAASGLARQTINRIENGTRNATVLAAAKIATALGRDYRDFCDAGGDGFGDTVRQARLRAGLKVTQLASITGLHPQTIHRIERGTRNAGPKVAAKLARTLGIEHRDFYEANGDAA